MKKTCNKCKQLKPSSEFYAQFGCKDNKGYTCRQCQSEIGKVKRMLKSLDLDPNKPYLLVEHIRKQNDIIDKQKTKLDKYKITLQNAYNLLKNKQK